jgi:hypothetical protein
MLRPFVLLGIGAVVLAVSVLGSGIAALDVTVVNIALPTIGRDFRTGVAALQWVIPGRGGRGGVPVHRAGPGSLPLESGLACS